MVLTKSDLLKLAEEKISQTEVNELVDIDLALIGNDDEVVNPTDVTSNSTTDSHMDAVTQQNGKNRTNAQFGGLDISNTLIEDVVNKIYEKFSIK